MTQVSIAEAKNHLPRLVQEAEKGRPVRITRRGLPVAVLMSEVEYERLTSAAPPLAAFLTAWRAEMDARNIPYVGEGSSKEWDDLRDSSERDPLDFT